MDMRVRHAGHQHPAAAIDHGGVRACVHIGADRRDQVSIDKHICRIAPEEPTEIEEVANVSETKAQARGEATTEEMLAPPEVREAIKKRRAAGPRARRRLNPKH